MDLWCDDCGAEQRGQCVCPDRAQKEAGLDTTTDDRWTGFDGHAYMGDIRRPSLAYHDDANCRCPSGAKHNPDDWF